MSYTHIFFDLDDTLWDYKANSGETLEELHRTHELPIHGIHNAANFIATFHEINDAYWDQYQAEKIDKEQLRVHRFIDTLAEFGVDHELLATDLSERYLEQCPTKPYLMPHAMDSLDYLSERYELHMITNGFEEVQHVKIASSGIRDYFEKVITSEQAGVRKPHADIFHFALSEASAEAHESVFIGDNLHVDMVGARNAGIDQVYYNPKGNSHSEELTHEIKGLNELKDLF